MLQRLRYVPYFLFILFTFIFFYKLAFSDLILARGDTYSYFYPYWDARNGAMRAGQLPLWTPDIFMGAPLLANPQLGTFYPPNWLTIPFTAPDAIRYSILLHLIWAMSGVFLLFRVTVSRAFLPSLFAAIVFGFGGFVSAHVEQINQLQGLSWYPFLFLLFHLAITTKHPFRWVGLLAVALALQIFSGHTQTVFISGFGLGLYAILYGFLRLKSATVSIVNRFQSAGIALLTLASASILAILLAIPQLLPTLELTGMSNRGGGFTAAQATAFSLPPTYLGRALLPSYDGQLFGEYIAYIGVIALGLAIWGIINPINETKRMRWLWLIIAAAGLLFAMGRFNPLYWQVAALPGFNLFRVPARWLSLYALAMAMLAGTGLHLLQAQKQINWLRIVLVIMPLLILMAMGRFLPVNPTDIVGPAAPTTTTLLMWAMGTVVLFILLGVRYLVGLRWLSITIVGFVMLELFLASRILPYNDLAPRAVYEGQRFTISQLLAYGEEQTPPGRILAISNLLFDPGDNAHWRERFEQLNMDEQAVQTAFTAIKQGETLMPNLPLTWGIASVDGFGGGVLPTIYYSQFTSLLLPNPALRTVDGRLGEMMALPQCRGSCLPAPERLWLLTGTRYIITDKVFDIWQDGVAYDTTFPNEWWDGILDEPGFEFTQVRVLHSDPLPDFGTGQAVEMDETLLLTIMQWGELQNLLRSGNHSIIAVTVVDTRTEDFVQLTPNSVERVLSSDIKIYDLLLSTRAFLSPISETILPDDYEGHEEALRLLRAESSIWIIHGDAEAIQKDADSEVALDWLFGSVEFRQYTPTRIEIAVDYDYEAYLILNDAFYPGWHATVNGEATQIYRANVMFRAVRVPEGQSTVIFEFVPRLWYGAMAFGAVVWTIILSVGTVLWRRASMNSRVNIAEETSV